VQPKSRVQSKAVSELGLHYFMWQILSDFGSERVFLSLQLQALQIRMHGFMMEYYKYRGLYNSAELARCEEESGKNSDKVTSLQDSMNSALSNITDFLQTQMTGDVAREMAWEQVQKQEAKAQRPPTKLKASNTVRVA